MKAKAEITYKIDIDDPEFPGSLVLSFDPGGRNELVVPMPEDSAEELIVALVNGLTQLQQRTVTEGKKPRQSSVVVIRQHGPELDS